MEADNKLSAEVKEPEAELTPYDYLRAAMRSEEVEKEFARTLGSNASVGEYITSALMAVADSDRLQKCTPKSIIRSAMNAARLRLMCGSTLGYAYLVPYYNSTLKCFEANFIVGYKGLNQLALRTGAYRILNDGFVYNGEELVIDRLTGKAHLEGNKAGDEIIGYFSFFEMLTGLSRIVYMSKEQIIDHVKKYAPKQWKNKYSVWHKEFDKMALKTVIRLNLTRNGYLSDAAQEVLANMEEPEGEMVIDDGQLDFIESDSFIDMVTEDEMEHRRTEAAKPVEEHIEDLGFDSDPEPKAKTSKSPRQGVRNNEAEQTPTQPTKSQPAPILNVLDERLVQWRTTILEMAKEHTGYDCSDKQRQLLRHLFVNIIFQDDGAGHHIILKWLFGKTSTSAKGGIKDNEVKALLDWLKPTRDPGGEYEIRESVRKVCYAIKKQGELDAGQQELGI